MTSPSPPRPGHSPSDPPRAAPESAGRDAGPPSGAVTLADLIADSGPLPADAALECVQRLAERLTLTPRVSCESLGPSTVLIDDDGGVWLDQGVSWPEPPGPIPPRGMERLGRLLAFLATADGKHFGDGQATAAADLPQPLSQVARRLFSRNGACYRSYAELAADAATLRGVAPPAGQPAPPADVVEPDEPAAEEPPEPRAARPAVEREPAFDGETPDADHAAGPLPSAAPATTSGASPVGIALIVLALVGAVIAFALWRTL